ncbi:MAG: UDP-N-acetylmuramoyl-L-alanine--D-glutamate ligase [Jatrophihabitantaceae bacterium]
MPELGPSFRGRTVLVCGTGLAGLAAVRALLALGARPLVTDDGRVPPPLPIGAEFVGRLTGLPAGIDAVVSSPGLPPSHPVLVAAGVAGVEVLGELEFAWRIQPTAEPRWLMVTGTNGKTTTVRMLEAMLRAAGLRAAAVGNVGVPITDAVRAVPSYQVLAVEASSFQLHFSGSLRPRAGALLNLAEDHLDWHGSMRAYARAKAKVFAGDYAIGNADDERVARLLADQPGDPIEFSLRQPAAGRFGVADGMLVTATGEWLLPAAEINPPGPHNVANALAAAALASTVDVPAAAMVAGLRSFVPDPHRNQLVAEIGGVRYVDDSKATNPHAAAAALAGYRRVVWIAGGQLKGADIEPLVAEHAGRFAGAVLLGVDRGAISAALSRHAPDLPVIEVARTDDGAMQETVAAATSLAHAGDVVLLAPGAASKDMFASYGARGLAFQAAVRALSDC